MEVTRVSVAHLVGQEVTTGRHRLLLESETSGEELEGHSHVTQEYGASLSGSLIS